MDKISAGNLVKETLQNPFDKDKFTYFIKNLLNEIDESKAFHAGGYTHEKYRERVKTYERIGTYTDLEGKKIDILVVYLQKEGTLDRARTTLRNFAGDYLKERGEKEAGLFAFVSPNPEDWRFSLVKMEYQIAETPSGRIKAKEEFTPAKRYSFLVGEHETTHTAQSRLAPIIEDDVHNPTLKQLEDAFNIEKVTKEFFEKYRELFLRLKESLDTLVKEDVKIRADFQEKEVNTVDFTKKLLGQIVFLYFLQKKGWFGVERGKEWGSGSKQFLRELFEKKHGNYENFFNDVLEPLFYNTLATERTKDWSDRFNCRIPFLNGGLFDPLNNYDWVDTDIRLESDIFSNDRKTKEGDVGDGVLDIFDRYNFTVKEDEPLEKEVAIDPEMLGKVFENLLEVKDRKSKGTYYTPREIVHYMCQESLINYLVTELESKIDKEDIETLIKYGETAVEHDSKVGELKSYSYKLPESVRENAKLIDEKLATIRVCDPAVGSGAFPVGMMNEIIRTRNALTPHIDKDGEGTPYHFKRQAIQNCLYGVDIDQGAVEIAKLRLWLSLIVDEEERETIQPLPNLDYKIIQGNSLLGIQKEKMGMRDMFYEEKMKELHKKKELFFNETSAGKKQEYRRQIDELITQITNDHKDFDFEVYFSEIFHEKKGFDVVITNPPYLSEKGHKDIFREVKNGVLGIFYQGKMDLFYFFFHLAMNLGHQKSNIAFITTNYYITATGATKLRKRFKQMAIRNLVNFNELKIFESARGQHNMITILQKMLDEDVVARNSITQRRGVAVPEVIQKILSEKDSETLYYRVKQKDLYDGQESYIRLSGNPETEKNPTQVILTKIKGQDKLLSNFFKINQGLKTNGDVLTQQHINKLGTKASKGSGIFILKKSELRDLNLSKQEKRFVKPFFKNSDIKKYFTLQNPKQNVLYITNSNYLTQSDKKLKAHLDAFLEVIESRAEVEPKGKVKVYSLTRPRKQKMFEGEKIVCPLWSKHNIFGYNTGSWYSATDVTFITLLVEAIIPIKYVLALLNSRLIYFWLYHKGKRKGELLELSPKPLSEIPIRDVSDDKQLSIVEVVDKVLTITKDDDYLENPVKQAKVREYEKQIDQLVYKLYGLTRKEIKIVEESAN